MSAKKKSTRLAVATTASASTTTPREVISTCQIKTSTGTPVTWTAFRQVGALPSSLPQCYVCTLPDNTDDSTPSEYNLNAIAAQGKEFPIALRALDRDVVYFVTLPGGEPQRMPVSRGEPFIVPARGSGADVTNVTLTFDGECCTVEAVPQTTISPLEEGAPTSGAALTGTDDDTPPPPLPSDGA